MIQSTGIIGVTSKAGADIATDDSQDDSHRSVLDAIQGDGFNPLWVEVQVVFNEGFTAHQFFSDEEIEDAADAGEITLVPTDEVYRCSVIGPK
jgi:hypothetical protein